MCTSAKALRALILAAALMAATLFSLASPLTPAQAQGLLESMFGGSGEPGISIDNEEDLVQVDEACVLIRSGREFLSVGDRCPQESSRDTEDPGAPPDPAPPAEKPAQQLGTTTTETTTGTTTGITPETTTGTTTGTTTDGEEESGLQEVTVKRAVDGDTLGISPGIEDTDTVRLIGLDTPEMATDEAAVPEPYAEEAAAFTAENLEGQQIFIETDEDLKDDYGRLLAYAWLGDPTTDPDNAELFNETLLREGYATLFTVEPNVLYEERLAAAEAAARSEGLGIWGLQPETTGSTGPESTTATTMGSTTEQTTALTTGEMTVGPEAVPTGDPDPLDLPEEDTQATSPTIGPEATELGGETTGGTTVVTSQDEPEGTTMDNTTVGGTTMGPEATGFESFDPEALKREATQLAQESLEDTGIQQPAAETSLEDTPADTPQEALQTPTEVPVSQMTEAPVSTLPDTGGIEIGLVGGLVLLAGLAAMVAYDRRNVRAGSPEVSESLDAPGFERTPEAGPDEGSGR